MHKLVMQRFPEYGSMSNICMKVTG